MSFIRAFSGTSLKPCALPACLLVSALLASVPNISIANQPADHPLAQYEILKKNLRTGAVYRLRESINLDLPDMHVTLISGRLQFLQGSDSTTAGFLFEGQGEADFAPRHKVERLQVVRFLDRDSLHATFDYFVLKSVEVTIPLSKLEALDNQVLLDENAAEFLTDAEASLLERIGFNLPSRLLTELILPPTGFTGCIFRDQNQGRTFPPIYYYFHDPVSFEQVQLMQYRPKALGKPFYTICRYPLGKYLDAPPEGEIRIDQYTGWVHVGEGAEIVADLGADIVAGQHKLRTLYFQLSKLLKMERVTSEEGDTLQFIQENNQTGFTLFLPEHLTPVDTLRLRFHYRGAILQRRGSRNAILKDPTHWHPRLGYLRRARYKIVYKYPRSVDLVANGQLVREWLEGPFKLSYYFQRVPAKASMFLVGKFRRHRYFGPNRVAISMFSSSRFDDKVLRSVNKDVVSSLYLFSQNIAPYEYNHLAIVEASSIDSQGYPGFVKLSNLAFRDQSGGTLAATRSHEIAHQWWGNLVGWRTYRDQWLSESFAEYMGALYIAYQLPGEKQFQQILSAWRDDLLEGGNIGVSLGLKRFGFSKDALRNSNVEKAGPIYLGIRLGQRESAEYYLLVYQKGAYLLHTLRNYLRDDTSGSDQKFWQLLRDFAATHAGSDPATSDFIAMTSAHAGESMAWFFEQWLLGQEIPTYRYDHKVVKGQDGFRIEATIEVESVSANFKSFVPLRIEFADGSFTRRRFVFQGNRDERSFGPFRSEPIRVEFNAEQAVLARSK